MRGNSEETAEEREEVAGEAVSEIVLSAVVFCMEGGAVLLVCLEELLELAGGRGIKDETVDLIVEKHAAGVEVGAAYGAGASVNHHHLGVVEASLVVVDFSATLGQLLHLECHNVGGDGYVALGGHHDFEADAPLQCAPQCASDAADVGGVGVDDLDVFLCGVDGCDVCLAHDF